MKKFLILLSLLFLQTSYALPARVIIIRHGEKPPTGKDLNTKGYERAAALPFYFKKLDAENKIVAVYAMGLNQEHASSKRPIETCTPTAQSLGLPIHTEYTRKEYSKLAEFIKNNPDYDHKTVLICWEHHIIPPMVQQFGVTTAPSSWPNDVFDATWIINYADKKQPMLVIDSQQLLYGDKLNVASQFTP